VGAATAVVAGAVLVGLDAAVVGAAVVGADVGAVVVSWLCPHAARSRELTSKIAARMTNNLFIFLISLNLTIMTMSNLDIDHLREFKGCLLPCRHHRYYDANSLLRSGNLFFILSHRTKSPENIPGMIEFNSEFYNIICHTGAPVSDARHTINCICDKRHI
jgi:hypothetical protein